LNAVLLEQPEHPTALFLTARLYAHQGKVAEAIKLLAMIPANTPSLGMAAMGQRGDYLRQLKRFEESIPLWKQMLTLDDSNLVRSRLAHDLYAVGQRIESAWHLQELADRSAASEDELQRLLNITNPPKSLDELVQKSTTVKQEKSSAESFPTQSTVSLSQAWELIHQRRGRDASIMLELICQTIPSTEATTLLALTQTETQQFERARLTLSSAPPDAPRFAPYWIAVGDDWGHRDDQARATAAYVRAMLADSTWDLTHERLIGALLKLGRTEDAKRVDERRFALTLPVEASIAVGEGQPEDERAGSYLVNDLKRLGQMSQACGWMRHIAARNPGAFGGRESVERQCREMLSLPIEAIQSVRLVGIDVQGLPDPTPVPVPSESIHEPVWSDSNAPLSTVVPPMLVDVAKLTGLDVVYHNLPDRKAKYLRLHEGLGSGVAALDYDRDGWTDLYFGQGSGDPPQSSGTRPNVLVRKLDGRFQDITMLAGCDDRGYAMGVSAGDWNQDGWDDVLVGNFGGNRLFINQGDGTFEDATEKTGLLTTTFTSSVAFADVDSDGLTDIVEINYVDDPAVFKPLVVKPNGVAENYPGPNQYRSTLDVVWLSQGDGTAKRLPLAISSEAIANSSGATANNESNVTSSAPQIGDDANPGLGVIVSNIDVKPGLEIFVANDARPNQLWKMVRDGASVKLTETAAVTGLATSSQGRTTASMGVAAADFNRDGTLDLFVTNWFEEWVNLYLQHSQGVFQDLAPKYQLDKYSDRHVGFGTQGVDYDNDGWVDLVVANGHINDYSHLGQGLRMLPQLLINRHDHFEQATFPAARSDDYWTTPHIGRCVITTDHNRDGRMDAVVTDLIDPVVVLENQTLTDRHFIQFHVVGTACERNAIGTQVEILGAEPKQVAVVTSGDGYFGRNEPILHFGLGPASHPVAIRVTWPDNSTQQFDQLAVDARYLLVQGEYQPTSL
jgi:tetratricopeptide (TPR) repeat protein